MDENSDVVRLRQPDAIDDPLTEVLRAGARQLLTQAAELEVGAFLAERASLRLPDGRARLMRHGHGPERAIQTGIGAIAVARPNVRDRGAGEGGERIRFASASLPRWARRTRNLDVLRPTMWVRCADLLRGTPVMVSAERVFDGPAPAGATAAAFSRTTPNRRAAAFTFDDPIKSAGKKLLDRDVAFRVPLLSGNSV